MATRTVKYSYRAYPTPEQEAWLAGAFGAMRAVYNDYIWQKERVHRGEQEELFPLDQYKRLSEHQSWMREYPQKCAEQARRNAETAYKNYFESLSSKRKGPRVGKPRYKKRKKGQGSLSWNGASLKQPEKLNKKWSQVYLPKHGTMLRFRVSRPLPSKATGVTLKLLPSGEYRLSFTVQEEIKPKKTSGPAAGIDSGLATMASVVKDDGSRYKVANPRYYRSSQRKLARADAALSRKEKGSKGYEKARLARAKAHARVARLRKDYINKVASRLASENQAVSLEDLSIKALKESGLKGYGKAYSDAGLGLLKQALESACFREGAVFELVPPAGTTRGCAVCGEVGGPSGVEGLGVREWCCTGCGSLLDRDFNSGTNVLLAGGHSERLNGPGGRMSRVELASAVSGAMAVEGFTRGGSVLLDRPRRSRVKSLARRARLGAAQPC